MAIERDTVTIWHDAGTPKKAEWHRTIVTNVRVDWSAGSVPGSVGAPPYNWSRSTRLILRDVERPLVPQGRA